MKRNFGLLAVLVLAFFGALGCSRFDRRRGSNPPAGVVIYYSGCPGGWGECYYYNNYWYYYSFGVWWFGGNSEPSGGSMGQSFDVQNAVQNIDSIELPVSGTDANGLANSVSDQSKDTGLARSELQQQGLEERTESFAQQFQMNADSARQLVQLADRVQASTVQGQMTAQDRAAIVDSAMGVAGITATEVNAAVTKAIQSGDQTQIDALMDKAAKNLQMPSSAGLRDQLLPALGIQF